MPDPRPSIEALERTARATWEGRTDLRNAFPDPSSTAYWVWVNTHGHREVPALAALLPPVPPREVYRFSNTSDAWGYLLTGGSTYAMVSDLLARQGTSLDEVGSVLDFGCGPGRGIRGLYRHAGSLEIAGTDVDGDAIAWCRAAMPFARFEVNGELPPTSFASESFGLVFSVSVFSHLSERSSAVWLEELHRVLRPGGLAILTIHGEHALGRVLDEPKMFQMIEVERPAFEQARERFGRGEFGFVPQPKGHLTTELYGVAFLPRAYIARQWTRGFDLEHHRVAAVDDWQDAVVLRRR